jgi:glycosyltransferase involved in cell wall biosynthesis
MKILLVGLIKYLSPFSGGSKANQALLEWLAARGHSCRVLTTSFPIEREQYLSELRAQGIEVGTTPSGLPVYRHRGVEARLASSLLQLGRELINYAREFDPTWIVTSDLHLAEVALEASPARVVFVTHSAATLPFGPDCAMADAAKTKLLGRMAGVLTVSKYMEHYLRQFGQLESTSIYWPAYGSPPFPLCGNFDGGYVTLVNTALTKGLPIFLELARRLPDVEFALVPTRALTDEARAALMQSPNVTILRPQEDIDKIFARTRVLLAPSLCPEAFGQVVVDAMARGVPVLGSNLGGVPEAKLGVDYVLPVSQVCYARHELTGYTEVIPEQDAGPWEEALGDLLGSRERYECLSSDSRAAALRFIGGLGFEHFERYFESLTSAGAAQDEAVPAMPSSELQERLSQMSPERRALLALRLKKQGGAQRPADMGVKTES